MAKGTIWRRPVGCVSCPVMEFRIITRFGVGQHACCNDRARCQLRLGRRGVHLSRWPVEPPQTEAGTRDSTCFHVILLHSLQNVQLRYRMHFRCRLFDHLLKGREVFFCLKHTHRLWGSPGILFNEYFSGGEKLTVHLHVISRLRINGVIPLLFLHAFMVWTGTKLGLSSLRYKIRLECLNKNSESFWVKSVGFPDRHYLSPYPEKGSVMLLQCQHPSWDGEMKEYLGILALLGL